jgi:hypothetical protein
MPELAPQLVLARHRLAREQLQNLPLSKSFLYRHVIQRLYALLCTLLHNHTALDTRVKPFCSANSFFKLPLGGPQEVERRPGLTVAFAGARPFGFKGRSSRQNCNTRAAASIRERARKSIRLQAAEGFPSKQKRRCGV